MRLIYPAFDFNMHVQVLFLSEDMSIIEYQQAFSHVLSTGSTGYGMGLSIKRSPYSWQIMVVSGRASDLKCSCATTESISCKISQGIETINKRSVFTRSRRESV